MKHKGRFFFLILMFSLITCSIAFAEESYGITKDDISRGIEASREFPVSLQVDGQRVITDVQPVIINDRTLIPFRAVFENMGGIVGWNDESREAEVSLGTSNVKMWIDSKTAFLNGNQKELEVPALIINDRTMIPVRFVAESLNCNVDWDNDLRTVIITSPEDVNYASVNEVFVEDLPDKYRIVIKGQDVLGAYKTFAYDNPERFGIDIQNARLTIDNGSIESTNDILESVRFAQFEENTIRIVSDLKEKVAGKISMSEDKKSIYIDYEKGKAEELEELGDTTSDGLPVLDWRVAGKLIVIDPGHGGRDPGSQGKRNGVSVLDEKVINLDVAEKLNQKLKAAGANTYMLREDDSYISLYERPELANGSNGDLYISIHNNSYKENPNVNGTEVFYYAKSNESNYGISSAYLAKTVQKELIAALKTSNRGAKSEPAYAVLNKTLMPAIIIEGAFLSNEANLEYMLTDDFREKYAYAVAKATIQVLNESVIE